MLAALSVISIASLAATSAATTDSVKARSLATAARSNAVASTDAATRSASLSGAPAAASAELIPGLVATAARYLGTRYRFGGTRPGAFDCSGFVRYVFGRHGMQLPRTAREQAEVGRAVVGGIDSVRTGDLLFFRTRRGRAAHVAIYVGEGRIIHASAGSRRVRYDDLGSARGRWFISNLSGVRRVIDGPDSTNERLDASAVRRIAQVLPVERSRAP
jgi:cell wall-associated NlpC family hydrolase